MPEVNCGFNDPENLYLIGPTLWVEIGFDANFRPLPGSIPQLSPDKFPALVDTGALDSCIDSALATSLNLPIIDNARVSGVGGATNVNIHLAQIHVPELNRVVYGGFAGVHLSAGGQRHLALIGRSFLRDYSMSYDGRSGTVILVR